MVAILRRVRVSTRAPMASAPAYALLLLSLPFLAAAQTSPAAAPAPAALPNPVAILKKGQKFGTLLTLLQEANLVEAIGTQLNRKEGITIFAPTDSAFKKIPAATLAKLTPSQKTTILTYHVLPQYVSFNSLAALSNPVTTLAAGLTLNFIGGNGKANVSTGSVNTKVEPALSDMSPLAIFPVEDVLLPANLTIGAPAAGPAGSKGPSPSPGNSAPSFERRVGWGAVAAASLACLSFF